MRGIDLPAKMRAISRILGVEVIHEDGPEVWRFYTEIPTVESGPVTKFEVRYRLPSHAERALKMLHSDVYRARGAVVYKLQNEKCAMCGKRMPVNQYEIDHKYGRGRGRSDRIEDIQAVCTGLSGCDLHRRKHGG